MIQSLQKKFPGEFDVQDLLQKANNLVLEDESLNQSKKDKISDMLMHVDFLLGKYDKYFERFSSVFEAITVFDFTKDLVSLEEDTEFIKFFSLGLNMIKEELEDKAVHKNLLYTMFEAMAVPDTMMVITDCEGRIKFVNSGINGLPDFNEATLRRQKIHVIFDDFTDINEKIKEQRSFSDLDVLLKWKGKVFPSRLTVSLACSMGRIDGLIYIIKLPSFHITMLPK